MIFPSLRQEIEEVRIQLTLSDNDFREVQKNQWESILSNILSEFVQHSYSLHWAWERFKVEAFGLDKLAVEPYTLLDKLIPNDELIWFIVEEDTYKTKHWVYEGTITAIQKVIQNTIRYEYYIVSKKYNWIVCENHHEVLIGTGDMIHQLKKIQLG